jgi:hypothetical protein
MAGATGLFTTGRTGGNGGFAIGLFWKERIGMGDPCVGHVVRAERTMPYRIKINGVTQKSDRTATLFAKIMVIATETVARITINAPTNFSV